MSAEAEPVAKSEDSDETRLRLVVADDPEERVIAEVAGEIRGLARRVELEFTCAVGRLLVERFYGGDRAAWRDHSSGKAASFRRLAENLRDDRGLCASALWRCVAIHDLVERLGGVAARQHLSATHFRAVLALPEPDQRRLLDEAAERSWTSRELEAAARGTTSRVASRRPPSFVAAIRRIERVVVEQNLALKEIGRARELGPAATNDLYGRVMRIRERIELLQKALSPKVVAAARTGARRTDDLS